MAKIKVRAKASNGVTEVKALMDHPMETGLRKNSKGELIPAHYIQEVSCMHGDNTVMTCHWGPAVSKNPYISFKFNGGAKGDKLVVSWKDNMGEEASQEAEIK